MEERCAAGFVASRCCVGTPWADSNPYLDDPLDPAIIEVAVAEGVEPHALHDHVEGVHGWEAHDTGYRDAVIAAAHCLKSGGCAREYSLRAEQS